jgi:membrane protein implicated in regulation of membrane protease activity
MSSIKKWLLIGAAVIVLCAISGGLGSWIGTDVRKSTYVISYADFIVIMLTAVAVMVTVLAVIVAVAAFVGWQSFDNRVSSSVNKTIIDGFEPGERFHALFADKKNRANLAGVPAISETFESDAEEESKGEREY